MIVVFDFFLEAKFVVAFSAPTTGYLSAHYSHEYLKKALQYLCLCLEATHILCTYVIELYTIVRIICLGYSATESVADKRARHENAYDNSEYKFVPMQWRLEELGRPIQ